MHHAYIIIYIYTAIESEA
jgi:hypothetical protein